MNIPILNMFGHDNDGSVEGRQSRVDYILQAGTLSSALEHAVPERLLVTEETPGEAISAVRALEKASASGQRIYHITPANQAQVLPNVHHNAQVMADIGNALNAGRDVITHTDAVSVPGWSGAGYIIFDPVTGDGAYKLGGGQNGAFFTAFFLTAIALAVAVKMIAVGGVLMIAMGVFLFIWEVFWFSRWIAAINAADSSEQFDRANAIHGLATMLGLVSFGGVGALAARIFASAIVAMFALGST